MFDVLLNFVKPANFFFGLYVVYNLNLSDKLFWTKMLTDSQRIHIYNSFVVREKTETCLVDVHLKNNRKADSCDDSSSQYNFL